MAYLDAAQTAIVRAPRHLGSGCTGPATAWAQCSAAPGRLMAGLPAHRRRVTCGAIDHPPGVAAGGDPKTSSATRA